jgi:hypothetical protein
VGVRSLLRFGQRQHRTTSVATSSLVATHEPGVLRKNRSKGRSWPLKPEMGTGVGFLNMAKSRGWTGIRILWTVAVDMLRLISSVARSHSQLAAENLFLRKQLAFYVERQVKPRRADDATRITLVALSSLIEWRPILMIVKPDTLIGWHRRGFRLFWRRKSKPRGRPRLPSDLRQVIRKLRPPTGRGARNGSPLNSC